MSAHPLLELPHLYNTHQFQSTFIYCTSCLKSDIYQQHLYQSRTLNQILSTEPAPFISSLAFHLNFANFKVQIPAVVRPQKPYSDALHAQIAKVILCWTKNHPTDFPCAVPINITSSVLSSKYCLHQALKRPPNPSVSRTAP